MLSQRCSRPQTKMDRICSGAAPVTGVGKDHGFVGKRFLPCGEGDPGHRDREASAVIGTTHVAATAAKDKPTERAPHCHFSRP